MKAYRYREHRHGQDLADRTFSAVLQRAAASCSPLRSCYRPQPPRGLAGTGAEQSGAWPPGPMVATTRAPISRPRQLLGVFCVGAAVAFTVDVNVEVDTPPQSSLIGCRYDNAALFVAQYPSELNGAGCWKDHGTKSHTHHCTHRGHSHTHTHTHAPAQGALPHVSQWPASTSFRCCKRPRAISRL